jgi:hypothetical protein
VRWDPWAIRGATHPQGSMQLVRTSLTCTYAVASERTSWGGFRIRIRFSTLQRVEAALLGDSLEHVFAQVGKP